MSRQRTSVIEEALHRIEDRIEEWREQDRAHKAEAATQREKLLAEAVTDEVYQYSTDEVARRHRVVFVMHSEETSQALEPIAVEKACLEKMAPGRGGYEEAGMKGSWLMFERPECESTSLPKARTQISPCPGTRWSERPR